MDNEWKDLQKFAQEEANPTRIGKYSIIRSLGQGGMGKVYQGYDEQLARSVAIKVLYNGDSQIQKEQVKKEARLTAQLSHPNIITIYEVAADHNPPYIAMEFIEGTSLYDLIRAKKKPSLDKMIRHLLKVTQGLHHAHREGILHRDIKPANVMIAKDGEPKVMDFGLAKHTLVASSISSHGMVVGTPIYASPEQMDGQTDKIDQRSDVYSLGATLYEMLTGDPPFKGESLVEVAMAVFKEEPKPPREIAPEIPRELEMICLKCLAKRQKQRYASAQALASDLQAYLDKKPLSFQKKSSWKKNSSYESVKNNWVVAIMILSLGLNILFLGLLFSSKPPLPNTRKKTSSNEQTAAPIPTVVKKPDPYKIHSETLWKSLKGENLSPKELSFWGQVFWGLASSATDGEEQETLFRHSWYFLHQAAEIHSDSESAFLCYLMAQKNQDFNIKIPKMREKREYYLRLAARSEVFGKYIQLQKHIKGGSKSKVASKLLSTKNLQTPYGYVIFSRYSLAHQDYKIAAEYARKIYTASYMENYKAITNVREWYRFANIYFFSEACSILGEIYLKTREYKKAEACWKNLRNLEPRNIRVRMGLAKTYKEEKRFDKAIAELNFVRGEFPGYRNAHEYAMDIFMLQEKYQDALDICNILIGMSPEKVGLYLDRAECFTQLRQYPQALKDLETVAKLDPQNPKVYLLKLQINLLKKQQEKDNNPE